MAARCLSCGNCTMVCPTCFCTTVEDVSDVTGTHAGRWLRWDSCFDLDFSHLHGGPVRTPEVDVSNLAIGDVLTVGDLPIPDGVRVLTDRAQAVATVAPPAAEEVAPVAAVEAVAAAPAEPEVLTERKPKEEPEAVDDKAKKK